MLLKNIFNKKMKKRKKIRNIIKTHILKTKQNKELLIKVQNKRKYNHTLNIKHEHSNNKAQEIRSSN